MIVASAVVLAAVVAVAATPGLLGARLARALDGLAAADPRWLALVCLGFAGSIVCSAQSWRTAARALGGPVGRGEACARFSVGALVNAVAPAKLGEAVRVALFAQVLPGGSWAAAGLFGTVGAVRALVIALTVVAASATGALPLWPVFVLLGGAAALATAAAVARRRASAGRLGRLLDALAIFVRAPAAAVRILGWTAGVSLARVCAATAAAGALGVPHPLAAALVIVPALDLAGTLPLTPGNVGVTSGAVALALKAHGIGVTTALGTGIAFNAAEILVGVACGAAGVLCLTGLPRLARPPRVVVAGVTAVSLAAAALGCALAGVSL
jgi:uncharacterized membrane protein YbhN (UPF0104 family)